MLHDADRRPDFMSYGTAKAASAKPGVVHWMLISIHGDILHQIHTPRKPNELKASHLVLRY